MRSVRIGLVVVGLLAIPTLALTACTADDPLLDNGGGPEDRDAAVTDSGSPSPPADSGDLAPDAAPPANCPLNCLPPPPAGWVGPSAVYDGTFANVPADCAAPYTLDEISVKRDITAAATTCACGNPSFTGANCNFDVFTFTDGTCTAGQAYAARGSGTCIAAPQSVQVTAANLTSSGTCTFPTPTKTVPTPTVGTGTKACGLPVNASCSADRPDCTATPIPDGPYTRLCIHKPGDEPCPSQDYPARFVSYRDFTDDRGCSACTGTASGGTCPTVFGWANDTFCTAAVGTQRAIDATCNAYGGSRLVLYNPTGMTCSVTAQNAPTGGIQPTGPETFCCAK